MYKCGLIRKQEHATAVIIDDVGSSDWGIGFGVLGLGFKVLSLSSHTNTHIHFLCNSHCSHM